jgi:hypothetical protein
VKAMTDAGKVERIMARVFGVVSREEHGSASWIGPSGRFFAAHQDHIPSAARVASELKVRADPVSWLQGLGFIRMLTTVEHHDEEEGVSSSAGLYIDSPDQVTPQAARSVRYAFSRLPRGSTFKFDVYKAGTDKIKASGTSSSDFLRSVTLKESLMKDIESLLGGLLVEDKYLERLDYEMTPLKAEAILDAHVHHHKINFGDEFGMHTPRAGEVLAAVEYVRKKARRTGQPMNAEQARHWIDANHGKFFEKEPDDETPVKKESAGR